MSQPPQGHSGQWMGGTGHSALRGVPHLPSTPREGQQVAQDTGGGGRDTGEAAPHQGRGPFPCTPGGAAAGPRAEEAEPRGVPPVLGRGVLHLGPGGGGRFHFSCKPKAGGAAAEKVSHPCEHTAVPSGPSAPREQSRPGRMWVRGPGSPGLRASYFPLHQARGWGGASGRGARGQQGPEEGKGEGMGRLKAGSQGT